jgi:hypothetical protein
MARKIVSVSFDRNIKWGGREMNGFVEAKNPKVKTITVDNNGNVTIFPVADVGSNMDECFVPSARVIVIHYKSTPLGKESP